MKHFLPAAAVEEGSTVVIPPDSRIVILHDQRAEKVSKIHAIENATPKAGLITWRDRQGSIIAVIPGNSRVEVLNFPGQNPETD